MFPENFDVDLEGKRNEYEGVVIIPHACPVRIRKAFKNVEHLLSEYDRARNSPGSVVVYKN